ncbi:MAG: response regulator, partial [Bacilli bacterium]|nr:response regulator [Bacilli bacterium]
ILVASNSLLDTINGILDISKIESNILEIKTNSYRFKKLFDELCLLGKSRINGKNIEFRSWADPYIPEYLIGDFIHVKQVVLNILTNAIKYTKEGYVDFKINTKLSDKYCTLIISVEDTGIGIKKEDLNRLFTKFDRLGVERQMQIEGTGLGLALTKRLVDLMNGKISVTSEYGKGSTFTVELIQGINTNVIKPVKEEIKVSSLNLFKGKNVLVVDDNVTGLKVITKFLNKYGINVTTLRSGEEAIKYAIFGNKTDLIFMDDVMPSLSGTETLKKLKKINGFNVPVVMLTANVITGMREKYLEQGFDEYLAKPINTEELDEILIKFLR